MAIGALILLFLLALYTIIPFVLSRLFGIGVSQSSSGEMQLALTFDDGPDPIYTNELLDVLKEYNVKASFFIVGSRAEQYPDIIRRIHEERHLIGIHNYVHRSNWLMAPWQVKRGIEKTADLLEEITGKRPQYYRPPWGMLNLMDFFIHKDYRIILWSVMADDWRSKGGEKKVIHHLRSQIKPGAIILLHDCGVTWGADEEAPEHTIEALRQLLPELSKKGFSFLRVDEMLNEKRYES